MSSAYGDGNAPLPKPPRPFTTPVTPADLARGLYRVEGTVEVTDICHGGLWVRWEGVGLPKFLSVADAGGLDWAPVGDGE